MYIEKTPLIIDTDPGVDDAVALIQAYVFTLLVSLYLHDNT